MTGMGIGLSLASMAVLLASPVYAVGSNGDDGESATATDGQVTVTVTGVGTTVEGGSFPVART